MSAKKYTLTISFFLILFVIYHFVIWNFFTKFYFYHNGYDIGDLGRMSFEKGIIDKRENVHNLPKKHIPYSSDLKSIDVITLGDSFSNGGGRGKNSYYQDFVASYYGLEVLNIHSSSKGYIETVLMMNDSGLLDKLKPKYIIIESVERSAVDRLAKPIMWDIKCDIKCMDNFFVNIKTNNGINSQRFSFLNTSNYNYPFYKLFYDFDDNAFLSPVYIVPISKELFSTPISDKLTFYYADLSSLYRSEPANLKFLNDNLNKLANILKKKNINLVFMPAVDKYTLYAPFIISNPYKQSQFFELLRPLHKDYYFVDTKALLYQLLQEGTKDVYYADDTHWSPVGSSFVVKNMNFLDQ